MLKTTLKTIMVLVLLEIIGTWYMDPSFWTFLPPHQIYKVLRKLFDNDSTSIPKVNGTSSTLMLDTIIVGGGIAGLGAAQTCIDHNMSCLLLEKNDYIGGDARTLKMPSKIQSNGVECNVDIGFMFGKDYHNLERDIKGLGLTKVDEHIEFTSDSFSNTFAANTEWNEELYHFLHKARNVTGQKSLWQMTFSKWLKLNDFTPGFVSNIIIPALSILFVTGRGSLEKPAYLMLQMLVYEPWINLDPEQRGIKRLFRVRNGNGQIAERLVEHYNINVRTNSVVHRVTVHDDHVTVLYGDNVKLQAKNVVFATDPVTVRRVYANPSVIERAMLQYYGSKTEKTYGILHSDLAVLGGATTQYVYNASTRLLSGTLGYENASLCPYVLSIHPNKMALPSGCEGACRWQEYEWIHPVQGLFTMLSTLTLRLPQHIHHPRVRYAGSWTKVLSHEEAYISGLSVRDEHSKVEFTKEEILKLIDSIQESHFDFQDLLNEESISSRLAAGFPLRILSTSYPRSPLSKMLPFLGSVLIFYFLTRKFIEILLPKLRASIDLFFSYLRYSIFIKITLPVQEVHKNNASY